MARTAILLAILLLAGMAGNVEAAATAGDEGVDPVSCLLVLGREDFREEYEDGSATIALASVACGGTHDEPAYLILSRDAETGTLSVVEVGP